jgi:hypothetical protein
MSSIERTLEEQRIRVEKLITVYGLDRTLGQGGFSTPLGTGPVDDEPLDDARRRELSLMTAMRRLQLQVDLLAQYEAANAEIVRHTPSILPVPPISSCSRRRSAIASRRSRAPPTSTKDSISPRRPAHRSMRPPTA